MLKCIGSIENLEENRIAHEIVDYVYDLFKNVKVHIYLGYPFLFDELKNKKETVDIAIISEIGVYFFNILCEKVDAYNLYQDIIYNNIYSKLLKNPKITNGRKLKININIATFSKIEINKIDNYYIFNSYNEIREYITSNKNNIDDETYNSIKFSIQEAFGLNTNVERKQAKIGTKAYQISEMSKCINTYDSSQMEAILTDPEGIQRIRGMAGSGKTIILAKKAVQLHIQHPEWNIIVTYYTRSLHNQFENLIDRFYSSQTEGKKYNKEKLRIMHAWGSEKMPGLYYEICMKYGEKPLNYREALQNGNDNPFENACKKFIESHENIQKSYDCILIDEAQDFGECFLKLCLKTLGKENRLVYAYDELQQLDGEAMEKPKELFGVDIGHDTPLKTCYRNQSKVIVSAHAIGMRLYGANGIIQMPGTTDVWDSIGYCSDTEIKEGKEVLLYRTKETSPDFLKTDDEIIDLLSYDNESSMLANLLDMLNKNLSHDGLENKDIMIIDMDILHYTQNKNELLKLIDASNSFNFKYDFSVHLAGASFPEDFFRDDSIVYTSVRRAKGNEAYMVYVLNAQKCINSWQRRSDRNSLFTAITRTKGWVRILGYGNEMNELQQEFNAIKENDYKLFFSKYPSKDEQRDMFLNNKDLEDEQVKKIREVSMYTKKFNYDEKEKLIKELFGLKDSESKKIMEILERKN